jgi:tetratricopeptide (TPR) repeat protein
MKPTCLPAVMGFVLALLATSAIAQGAPASDPAEAALENLLQNQLDQMNDGASKLLDAVDKAENAKPEKTESFTITEKKPQAKRQKKGPRQQQPNPVEIKQVAVDMTKINMMEAAKHHSQAQDLLQQVRSAPTPQARRKLLQKAKQSISAARNGLDSALDAARNVPGIDLDPLLAPKPKRIKPIGAFKSKTYGLLQKIEKSKRKNEKGVSLPGTHRYDGAAIRKSMGIAPQAKKDPTLSGRFEKKPGGTVKGANPPQKRKPGGGTGLGERAPPSPRLLPNSDDRIRLGTGQDIDLSNLRDALGQAVPKLRGGPLFRTNDNGDILGLNFDILRVLATPAQWAEVVKIGGVSLESTFDLLDLAGIVTVATDTGLDLIETPVLISLKNLYAKVEPFAAKGWDGLPDALRYPGMIQRVKGFTLDVETRDVILIGEPARRKSDRIDIDSIILTLRSGWRDSTIMAISLDPKPQDFSGPQYPVTINVPQESVVAKIMLEADYAMKKIMLAAGFASDQRLVNVAQTLDRAMDNQIRSRFWLSPKPLVRGGAQISGDGRTLMVNTRVQTQTEALFLTKQGGLLGAGRADNQGQLAAAEFTKAYPQIETDDQVRPKGIFMRLHGLIDLIASAKFLRGFNVNYPILEKISALPYRRLVGDAGVPSYYPGVSSRIHSRGLEWQLSGGVRMDWPLAADHIHTTGNDTTRQLENALAGLRQDNAVATRANVVLTLPRAAINGPAGPQATILSAQHAARNGEHEQARKLFGKILETDPANMEAMLGHIHAEIGLGNLASAANALRRAMALSPDDDRLDFTALDLAWRHDRRSAFRVMKASTELRRRLNRHYTRLAGKGLDMGKTEKARQLIKWATDIWEDNGDAHIVSANIRSPSDSRRRRRDIIRGIRAYRKQMRKGNQNAVKRLAIALSTDAWQRGERAGHLLAEKFDSAGSEQKLDVGTIISDLEGGIISAREARQLDPALPNGLAAEASLIGFRGAILGEKPELNAALALAGKAIRKFPDHPMGFIARGNIHAMMQNFTKARADLTQAIRMAPGSPSAYLARAAVSRAAGDCQAARNDMTTFEELAPSGLAGILDIKRKLSDCR